ncbi:MAG: hypothetical protein LBM23_03705 [Propionibacteriaceae bacterium]|nr:hypothetical protein [Propionibacteriaceae bacterium]
MIQTIVSDPLLLGILLVGFVLFLVIFAVTFTYRIVTHLWRRRSLSKTGSHLVRSSDERITRWWLWGGFAAVALFLAFLIPAQYSTVETWDRRAALCGGALCTDNALAMTPFAISFFLLIACLGGAIHAWIMRVRASGGLIRRQAQEASMGEPTAGPMTDDDANHEIDDDGAEPAPQPTTGTRRLSKTVIPILRVFPWRLIALLLTLGGVLAWALPRSDPYSVTMARLTGGEPEAYFSVLGGRTVSAGSMGISLSQIPYLTEGSVMISGMGSDMIGFGAVHPMTLVYAVTWCVLAVVLTVIFLLIRSTGPSQANTMVWRTRLTGIVAILLIGVSGTLTLAGLCLFSWYQPFMNELVASVQDGNLVITTNAGLMGSFSSYVLDGIDAAVGAFLMGVGCVIIGICLAYLLTPFRPVVKDDTGPENSEDEEKSRIDIADESEEDSEDTELPVADTDRDESILAPLSLSELPVGAGRVRSSAAARPAPLPPPARSVSSPSLPLTKDDGATGDDGWSRSETDRWAPPPDWPSPGRGTTVFQAAEEVSPS